MDKTNGDVDEHVAQITPAIRQRDAETVLALMHDITGREPELWSGGIVGFGSYHYRYPTGTEGDAPLVAFAARKTSTTLYVLDGPDAHADDLAALGPHTHSKGCLYITDLAKVDHDALRRIVADAYARITAMAGTDAAAGTGTRTQTEITITG